MRSRRTEINTRVYETRSQGRAPRSPGREIASRCRELDASGREIAAGWDAMAAPHYAVGFRILEIAARPVTTNAGGAEKLGLRGKSRSAENARTPKSPAPETPSGAKLRTPTPNSHDPRPRQYHDDVRDDDHLSRRKQFCLERDA